MAIPSDNLNLSKLEFRVVVFYMAIPNELSSDIAVALIVANAKEPDQLHELKEILIEVHSTLQQMTERSRTIRSFSLRAGENDRRDR